MTEAEDVAMSITRQVPAYVLDLPSDQLRGFIREHMEGQSRQAIDNVLEALESPRPQAIY